MSKKGNENPPAMNTRNSSKSTQRKKMPKSPDQPTKGAKGGILLGSANTVLKDKVPPLLTINKHQKKCEGSQKTAQPKDTDEKIEVTVEQPRNLSHDSRL